MFRKKMEKYLNLQKMETDGIETKDYFDNQLEKYGVVVLPPMEAKESIQLIAQLGYKPKATILDPWYNRGVGGERPDYVPYIIDIVDKIKDNTDHLFLWGFPEIVALFVDKIKYPLEFVCWITWYFKN
jgi:hypothetical protein